MIEQKIEALIDSIDKNTAALIALVGVPVGTKPVPSAAPLKPPMKPAAKKPAKTEDSVVQEAAAKLAAEGAAADAADAAEEAASLTKDDVGKAIESLLKANKRNDAIALLKKYGGTSASTLPEKNYAAFCDAAESTLLSA